MRHCLNKALNRILLRILEVLGSLDPPFSSVVPVLDHKLPLATKWNMDGFVIHDVFNLFAVSVIEVCL